MSKTFSLGVEKLPVEVELALSDVNMQFRGGAICAALFATTRCLPFAVTMKVLTLAQCSAKALLCRAQLNQSTRDRTVEREM
jgi:hypothetical protein